MRYESRGFQWTQISAYSAGVWYPRAEWRLMVLYSFFQSLMITRAWARDQKLVMFKHSSRIRLLKDSTYPLRHGEPGGM